MISLHQSARVGSALPSPARPLVVELVGVAAAGKTSVLHALREFDDTLLTGLRPPKHRHVARVLPLVPTFLALHWPYRGLLWKEMKRITFLRTLDVVLQEQPASRTRAIVLDEGPVYMLARLRVYGGERIRNPVFDRWCDGALERWAGTLSLIVWLDAPDSILVHRLRTRVQTHRMQSLSDAAVSDFLASYRAAYEFLIDRFSTLGLQVLRVRTDRESLPEVVERVSAEIQSHLDRVS